MMMTKGLVLAVTLKGDAAATNSMRTNVYIVDLPLYWKKRFHQYYYRHRCLPLQQGQSDYYRHDDDQNLHNLYRYCRRRQILSLCITHTGGGESVCVLESKATRSTLSGHGRVLFSPPSSLSSLSNWSKSESEMSTFLKAINRIRFVCHHQKCLVIRHRSTTQKKEETISKKKRTSANHQLALASQQQMTGSGSDTLSSFLHLPSMLFFLPHPIA